MKGLKWYLSLFILVLLASLVAHIPAAWVYQQLPKTRGIDVTGISGTIWNGQLQQLSVNRQSYGGVSWRWQPSSLLSAKLQYQVRFGQGSSVRLAGKGIVGVGLSGLYAKDVLASVPVEQVLRYIPMRAPIELKGQLELSLTSLQYAAPWCEQASGSLAWSGSEILSPVGQLTPGPVIADLTCQAQNIEVKGKQNNDQVSSEFTASLNQQARYQSMAWFKPGANFPQSMAEQLKWLGNPNSQGRYQFSFAGKL
ncbi:type II secretion system protein N [Vibrio gangliei]|uniref:type II secretion system protein N n=1 Tax=Vibrio gangliei TaxID=2077090 RepID=UPI001300A79F|nr:type II secretion system protein N [Vibrio gangliei]